MENPKVFISYSWHPRENQIRVQQLAERLSSDGVHVIIDIWDLQSGQDKNKFMEQMVNNPEVVKVLLVCNKDYAEKANARKGGVGIESTIMSEEIYQKSEQTKFISLVYEYDLDGSPCVPTFAKSRLFIDMSSDDKFEEGYDQLLRDIYGKPRYQRPPIGRMPTYLEANTPVTLPTAHKVKAIKDAILSGNPNTQLLVDDYLDFYISSLLQYKIDVQDLSGDNFIERIETSISELLPLKDDFLTFAQAVAGTKYLPKEKLSDFFEKLLQFYADNEISLYEGTHLYNLCYDNYRYFNYDLFVSLITLLLSKELFDYVQELVSHHFCIIEEVRMGEPKEISFMRFRSYNYTLNKYKNEQQQLRRVSVVADTVKRNAVKVRFDDMIRTDLLLYYLSLIYPSKDMFERYWYPELSAYNRQFEILPKMASARFFNKAKVMFGVKFIEEYKSLILSLSEPDIRDGIHGIPDVKRGLSFENVGTIS